MAAIYITVSQSTNLFTISLDPYDWTGLTVNGTQIPQDSSGWYKWSQDGSPAPVHFVAQANSVSFVNNTPALLVSGSGQSTTTYAALLGYPPGSFTMKGLLWAIDSQALLPGAQPGPIGFNQGMMTGTFQTTT